MKNSKGAKIVAWTLCVIMVLGTVASTVYYLYYYISNRDVIKQIQTETQTTGSEEDTSTAPATESEPVVDTTTPVTDPVVDTTTTPVTDPTTQVQSQPATATTPATTTTTEPVTENVTLPQKVN